MGRPDGTPTICGQAALLVRRSLLGNLDPSELGSKYMHAHRNNQLLTCDAVRVAAQELAWQGPVKL